MSDDECESSFLNAIPLVFCNTFSEISSWDHKEKQKLLLAVSPENMPSAVRLFHLEFA
jgi:hypothetical protein